MAHIPVLVKEVLEYLNLKPGDNVVDATVGQGGHAWQILEKIVPTGKLLGIDWDAKQVEQAKGVLAPFGDRAVVAQGSYVDIAALAAEAGFGAVNAILLDLGYSSWHMEESGKGFSFQKNEPLDMRYDTANNITARKIVNEYTEPVLEKIIREFGEEKFSKKIAREIILQRSQKPIETTFQLVGAIQKAIPAKFQHGRIHYATKTFQALRVAVNGELENLREFLPKALLVLAPGGRLAIISFHSLEDRMVKQFFKEAEKFGHVTIITKKPIIAGEDELSGNPRARSAKLRAIIKNI